VLVRRCDVSLQLRNNYTEARDLDVVVPPTATLLSMRASVQERAKCCRLPLLG